MYKDFKDYYSILEIGFQASEAEIKAAFRKLARNYHPDKHPDEMERYTALFQEITEAYETLSDPQKKMDYDFRYRQMVLGEGPQYEYYVDDTPEDTAAYKHTYTRRYEGNFPFFRLGIALFIAYQVFRSVTQTANIEPDRYERRPLMNTPSAMPAMTEDMRELLRHSTKPETAPGSGDSVLLTPGKH